MNRPPRPGVWLQPETLTPSHVTLTRTHTMGNADLRYKEMENALPAVKCVLSVPTSWLDFLRMSWVTVAACLIPLRGWCKGKAVS